MSQVFEVRLANINRDKAAKAIGNALLMKVHFHVGDFRHAIKKKNGIPPI